MQERCAQWLMDFADAVKAVVSNDAMLGLTHRCIGSEAAASAQHKHK